MGTALIFALAGCQPFAQVGFQPPSASYVPAIPASVAASPTASPSASPTPAATTYKENWRILVEGQQTISLSFNLPEPSGSTEGIGYDETNHRKLKLRVDAVFGDVHQSGNRDAFHLFTVDPATNEEIAAFNVTIDRDTGAMGGVTNRHPDGRKSDPLFEWRFASIPAADDASKPPATVYKQNWKVVLDGKWPIVLQFNIDQNDKLLGEGYEEAGSHRHLKLKGDEYTGGTGLRITYINLFAAGSTESTGELYLHVDPNSGKRVGDCWHYGPDGPNTNHQQTLEFIGSWDPGASPVPTPVMTPTPPPNPDKAFEREFVLDWTDGTTQTWNLQVSDGGGHVTGTGKSSRGQTYTIEGTVSGDVASLKLYDTGSGKPIGDQKLTLDRSSDRSSSNGTWDPNGLPVATSSSPSPSPSPSTSPMPTGYVCGTPVYVLPVPVASCTPAPSPGSV
jgi:hypothetical protein